MTDKPKSYDGFTAEERDAMKQRATELESRKRGKDTEPEVLAKIAEMPDADRAIAERIHTLVKTHAPALVPKLWYGMPAYYRDGKVLCFFQAADKFKARYATFGFDAIAQLDEGAMWPTSFAITELSEVDAERLGALIAKAVN
ncbi:iron chaperone [Nocardia asteroides]|uniref:iron chaperone n=1 Tax=Nocardia asteroides TaxID=1824 RepID=UPI001E58D290|nr:DUF1801 domain-containing protein [Nocardia asteroides]UGT64277.1 DUF1801 domain-containing protein [Nocardia asteroides]